MAYFHCLIGGGSSGGGYELTVTCDAQFAGTSITCTDGVTTLTKTCPSASPYEVVFEIPNGGDWTISGVVGGQTVSTGVNIPTSAELIATVQQTVTIYSAKEDTISYTDIDGATQTITFASGATSKQVQITIEPNGSSITFTSSVAKNPDDLSQDYSKTFSITTSTTDIYLMPDAVKTLYWYGYKSSDIQYANTSDGWQWSGGAFVSPTEQTNYLDVSSAASQNCIVSCSSAVTISKVLGIVEGVSVAYTQYGQLAIAGSKNVNNNFLAQANITVSGIHLEQTTYTSGNNYPVLSSAIGRRSKLYAMWYE